MRTYDDRLRCDNCGIEQIVRQYPAPGYDDPVTYGAAHLWYGLSRPSISRVSDESYDFDSLECLKEWVEKQLAEKEERGEEKEDG